MERIGREKGKLTRRHNDNHKQDNDADGDPHAHLHVLPPHGLAHAVRAAPEALGRDGEVVRLVLEVVEALAALRDLVDVIPHHVHRVVDLLRGTGLADAQDIRGSRLGGVGSRVAACEAGTVDREWAERARDGWMLRISR